MTSKDDKLLKSANRIRDKFKTEFIDESDAAEMSFIDALDGHIKDLLGDNHKDIYTTLNEERLKKWHKSRWKRLTKIVFSKSSLLFCFLGVVTLFLMTEALDFYAVDGSITFRTYVKAALTEAAFIFLSVYRTSGKLQMLSVGFMRAALFSLMLFVISSGVIFTGTNIRSEISNLAEQIKIVEIQVAEKQKEINYYISIKWPRNATTSRLEKEKLVAKLLEIKQTQISEKKNESVSDLVLYQTYGRAVFRTLLLLISVLISRKLFKI